MPKSKKDLSREQFLVLADRLGQSPTFIALLEDDDEESRFARTEDRDDMIMITLYLPLMSAKSSTPASPAFPQTNYRLQLCISGSRFSGCTTSIGAVPEPADRSRMPLG